MYRVVALTKGDAPEIEALFKKVWPRAEEYPQGWRERRTLTRDEIVEDMERGYLYFGVRIDGKLVGIYKAIITEDGLFGEHQSVDPAYRRRGVAATMYEQFIEFARERGCKRVYVNILTSQEASERLVNRMGFKKSGVEFEQAEGMFVRRYEKSV